MKITLKKSCIVRPAEPTWQGIMSLSELDQIGDITHVSLIYFYRARESFSHDNMFITLTTSLKKVLVYFYPLAGRLRRLDGGRMELVCNNQGARVIEAVCEDDMEPLKGLIPSPEFQHLIPQVDYSEIVEDSPLLLAQLTFFRCGGVSLGFTISHVVVDGQSTGHLLCEWARFARGEPIGEPPFLHREVLSAGGSPPNRGFRLPQCCPPPLIVGEIDTSKESGKKTTVAKLKITKRQIQTLIKEANKNRASTRVCTRYEAIAAHIWRSACRARAHIDNQPTWLGIYVDVRKRVKPTLPDKFFGNAIFPVIAEGYSGELMRNPLDFSVRKTQEAIENVTCEYARSVINFYKNLDDLSPFQLIHGTTECFYGNPIITVTNCMVLPIYGLDFGWGKEIFFSIGLDQLYCDGDSYIVREGDDDVAVVICLHEACMEDFKTFFYEDLQAYAQNMSSKL